MVQQTTAWHRIHSQIQDNNYQPRSTTAYRCESIWSFHRGTWFRRLTFPQFLKYEKMVLLVTNELGKPVLIRAFLPTWEMPQRNDVTPPKQNSFSQRILSPHCFPPFQRMTDLPKTIHSPGSHSAKRVHQSAKQSKQLTIVVSKVTSLTHETRDDTMKGRSGVSESLLACICCWWCSFTWVDDELMTVTRQCTSIPLHTTQLHWLTSAKSPEVLGSLWNHIGTELHDHTAGGLASNGDVEVYLGVGPVVLKVCSEMDWWAVTTDGIIIDNSHGDHQPPVQSLCSFTATIS